MSYCDNKGIEHLTEFGRDRANKGYLDAEQQHREQLETVAQMSAIAAAETARATARAAAAAEEQARHAQEQAKEAQRAATAAEAQARFEKAVLWLSHSDDKGKTEFFADQYGAALVYRLAERLSSSVMNDPAVAREADSYNEARRKCKSANTAKVQAANQLENHRADALMSIAALEKTLEEVNKEAAKRPVSIGLGCVTLAAFLYTAFYLVGAICSHRDLIWTAAVFGLITFFCVRAMLKRVRRIKDARKRKLKSEQDILLLRKQTESSEATLEEQAESARALHQSALDDTKLKRETLGNLIKDVVRAQMRRCVENGCARDTVLEWLERAQTNYPSQCRINTGAVSAEMVKAVCVPLEETIIGRAFDLTHTKLIKPLKDVQSG